MHPVHCCMSRAGRLVHVRVGDDVGDRETPARAEDAGGLAEDRRLVAGEVDDAVGDDHVHGVVGQRDRPRSCPEELDVLDPGLALVAAGQVEHLVGHVEAVGLAASGRPAAPRAGRRCRRRSPRSRTVSPSCSSATAVGFPQPSEASGAASGSASLSPPARTARRRRPRAPRWVTAQPQPARSARAGSPAPPPRSGPRLADVAVAQRPPESRAASPAPQPQPSPWPRRSTPTCRRARSRSPAPRRSSSSVVESLAQPCATAPSTRRG